MPGIESVIIVKETVPSQASIAVAKPKEGIVPQGIGLSTTGQVMTGGVLSAMLIVCTHVAVLPAASVAIQVRVIV